MWPPQMWQFNQLSVSESICAMFYYQLSRSSRKEVQVRVSVFGGTLPEGFQWKDRHGIEKTLCRVANSLVSERTRHQRQYDRRVNKRQLQTQESKIDTGTTIDADLVVTESSGTESKVQDDSSRSWNDTDSDGADIRPIYDEELMAEVQLTAECNIFAIGKQHTVQPEIINEGRVDQYPEQCQVKSPILDPSPDNHTTEYSKQSLESKNILLKKTVAQFQKDFSRMEAHCIALELQYQN
ncbi:hypothetical protein Tco_1129147 [Tanacetum coccineum]